MIPSVSVMITAFIMFSLYTDPIEHFKRPQDIFHMSIWGGAQRKRLERGETPPKKNELEGDSTSFLSVTVKTKPSDASPANGGNTQRFLLV